MRLKDKTAIIVGAGRNNGKAIALRFAREGAALVLVAQQRAQTLHAVAEECEALGARVLTLLADVAKPEDANRVVKLGIERFAKVDVLVNAVGVRPHKRIWDFDYDEWHNIFAVNLHSTFYLAKALVPAMIERGQGGSIVALGGRAALTSELEGGAVVASKHGLYGLIKSLALDLGPHGIRANLLALAHIENERLHPEWYKHLDADASVREQHEQCPLGRRGKPHEVASTALFLASDDSSYITGDRIMCGGGRYM